MRVALKLKVKVKKAVQNRTNEFANEHKNDTYHANTVILKNIKKDTILRNVEIYDTNHGFIMK